MCPPQKKEKILAERLIDTISAGQAAQCLAIEALSEFTTQAICSIGQQHDIPYESAQ